MIPNKTQFAEAPLNMRRMFPAKADEPATPLSASHLPPPFRADLPLPEEVAQPVARAMAKKDRRIGVRVRLDPERFARLKEFARRSGRTSQNVVLTALEEYLDRKANGG